MRLLLSLIVLLCFHKTSLYAQTISDSLQPKISSQYLEIVAAKAKGIEEKLDKQSDKTLTQLRKQEARMKSKLMKIDSVAAKNIFTNTENKYQELNQKLNNTTLKQYIPRLDTLSTSLKFLEQNPELLKQVKDGKEKLTTALSKVKGLEGQLQKAEEIKKFLKERKQFLKDQLSKFGFAKELKKLNKQVYYYAQQVNEYKAILKDPKRIEKKILELLSKTKFFKEFMKKNSMLASLFRLPVDPGDPASQANLAGLQTRAQVNGFIQQQIAAGGPNARDQFNQNLQSAQSQLSQLKDKILKGGGGSSDDIIPDGFKPNEQKTKSFLKRLEYGTNIQSQKATNFFPTTSDLGLSLGYKLNDKSIIGIGASYKMGWGKGWNNIKLSSEGVGLRSFIDLKIKGSLWLSGGYEQQYRSSFQHFSELQDKSGWQQSGLIGISKVISLKTKMFKKTKMQLLWDFLSYGQIPSSQPLIFRVGYNF